MQLALPSAMWSFPKRQRPQRCGRYTLERVLACGGMAEVHLASIAGWHGFRRRVAIKRILPQHSDDPVFARMFRDEAHALMYVHHPNVVQVLDFGSARGRLFMAMEYVPGVDLAAICALLRENNALLPQALALHLIAQVLEGLAAVHGTTDDDAQPLRLVHRDVSPANILLAWDGTVKLADFGICAGLHRQHHTAVGSAKGKYAYMSPEQARGEALDARSDLFSVGAVLFELLTGSPLFDGADDVDVLTQARGGYCDPQRVSWLDPALQATLFQALAPETAQRYASAHVFQTDVLTCQREMGVRASTQDVAEWLRGVRASLELRRNDRPHSRGIELWRHRARLKKAATATCMCIMCMVAMLHVPWNIVRHRSTQDSATQKIPIPTFDISSPPVKTIEPETLLPVPTLGVLPSSMTVQASPWGLVTIEGHFLQREAPVHLSGISPGGYEVKIEFPPRAQQLRQRVKLAEGQHVRCTARFLPTPLMRCR